jgi:hypothetical protein
MEDADSVRLRQGLEPRGHVYAVAKHIAVFLDNVAKMDANADLDLFGSIFRGVVGLELPLDVLGALHGMHDGGEVDEKGVTNRFDDLAVMCSDGLVDHVIMYVQQAQHACFIRAHLTAETDDIGEHDGRQLARLGGCWRL